MAVKKTLLELVQNILSDMDSQDVNSIGDTLEAQQVARIVESTYYNLITTTDIPEHYELIKLTAASDSTYPTHFNFPENVKRIDKLWYDTSDDGSFEYTEVQWMDPICFIERQDALQSNFDSVLDKNGGTTIRVGNDKHPQYFTSFDDFYLILDSYDSTIDSTLQASKVRAMGTVFPVFEISDNYTPDLDAVLFPYLYNEARSMCMEVLKGGSLPKVEQAARRQKSYVQNDMYRTKQPNNWSNYGR